ncbi:hypothetical protein Tc00.1047053410199.40 [Trypanosoma cruzi]|uniref:Uncharacterized protein n=1 Tax=Trypanosoma cruzi (strain CL Brener) TaxID=353153 RepID=Q4CRG8_TRYCC|nr:uncharacterized protein Tc00.1047053410199.40 [Trypanosoma cruzi]EAN82872.1 hypothetical protein Tc00.1047053410199.40 [Trypanosoma cruzi]|eukprot:XP_804723.1 hypothetical protein Tc00.1047053410199.40 [Trypanosoma cruzi strain CL Brener]
MLRLLRTTTICCLCTGTFFFFCTRIIFYFASRWICWRRFGFGACFTELRLVCRLRFFHVILNCLMRCLPFFLRPAVSVFGHGGSSGILWLRARRTCRISRCCSLSVLVGE